MLWTIQATGRRLFGVGSPCAGHARRWLTAASVQDDVNRFHDRRTTDFILKMEGVTDSDSSEVLDSCETFVAAWAHVDPLLDKNPPVLVPGSQNPDGRSTVTTLAVTKKLCAAYRTQGFADLAALEIPFAVQCAAQYTLTSAFSSNVFGLFLLTRCAADLLEEHGSEALQEKYLSKMRSGEWFGTSIRLTSRGPARAEP